METGKNIPGIVPDPAVLRPWAQDCLRRLGVSAGSISKDLGLGKNAIADFLRTPGRDVTLSTAHGLTCKIREIAVAKDVELPDLGASLKGGRDV